LFKKNYTFARKISIT